MARKAHLHVRQPNSDRLGRPLDADELAAEDAAGAAASAAGGAVFELPRASATRTHDPVLRAHEPRAPGRARLGGQRVGLFSYGSGCASEMYSGVVGARASEVVARAGIDDLRAAREPLDGEGYERILALGGAEPVDEAPAPGAFRFRAVVDDKRTYAGG